MSIYHKVLLAITIIGFIIVKIHWIDVPLDRDEGTYLYLGKCLVEGYRPYVDFYEIKPPGVFVVYAIIYLIFGSKVVFLHIGLALIQLATSYLMYRLAKALFDNTIAGVTAFCTYLVFCVSTNLLSFGLNNEFLIVFFMLLSWVLMIPSHSKNRNYHLFFSGFLMAVAILIRQQAILFVIPYLGLYHYVHKHQPVNYKHLVFILLGGLVYGLLLLLYIFLVGDISEMYYWVWERPFSFYLENIPWSKGKVYMINFLTNFVKENWVVLIPCVIGFVTLVFSNKMSNYFKLFVILLILSSLLAIVPGNRFFPHYWIYLIPALSISAAGITLLAIRNKVILLLLISIISGHFFINRKPFFITPAIKTYSNIYGKNPNIAVRHVTDYLKSVLKKGEMVYVFGSEPQVYFLTGLVPPLRHVYVAFAFQPLKTDTYFQFEILDFLQKSKPKYIIHVQNSLSILLHPKTSKKLYESMFEIESNEYKAVLFAHINDDLSINYFYDLAAEGQSIFENNYVVLYKRND